MKVTLSFDNGPTANVTHEVLDVLRDRKALATFFVVGEQLKDHANRRAATRAVHEGHWVGNHTMTHSVQLGDSPDAKTALREIGDAQREIGDLASPGHMFRPFGAGGILGKRLFSRAAVSYLEEHSYTCVLWNCVPRDWEDPDGWVERCLPTIRSLDWSLVVLHDQPTGAMKHLPRFLDELDAIGADLVQEIPMSCVPIQSGRTRLPIEHLVT